MPASFDATIRAGLRGLGWKLPLLPDLIAERGLRFVRRATDPRWGELARVEAAGGFQPFQQVLIVPARSPLALWSERAEDGKDARDFNEDDRLVRQVLFLLHDYLHAWAYARIRECLPRGAAFLRRPIDEREIEDHVFCHLLSEAVATVGLDFWNLSEIEIERVVGMGTETRGLATRYRMEELGEHQRHFSRGIFDPGSRRFFDDLATFYCTGEFLGFGARDLARSPKLARWLTHELRYGESQRIYTRLWFSYLATGRRPSAEDAERPVRCRAAWQRALVRDVGDALFDFVREGRPRPIPRHEYEPRRRPIQQLDLRFVNLRSREDAERAAADPFILREQFDWLASHRASRHLYPGDRSPSGDAFLAVIRSKDALLLERFLAGEEAVPGSARGETAELFLLS